MMDMTKNKFSRLRMMSTLWISSLLAGCMTVAPLEPVKNAPVEFRGDNTVAVEFVSPMLVGARCAQRGANIFGIPQMNSMGCGDGRMITMPNPCQTITSGWYARLLCHELAHANGWSRTHEGGSYLPDEWAGVDPQAAAAPSRNNRLQNLTPASQSPQALAHAEALQQQAEAETDSTVQIASNPHEQTVQENVSVAAPTEAEFSSRVQLASTAEEVRPVTVESADDAVSSASDIGLRSRTAVTDAPALPPAEAAPATTISLKAPLAPSVGHTQRLDHTKPLPPNVSLLAPY